MAYVTKPIINYTHRDFETIKEDLVEYTQRYYPETFRDFNEASFGSLMLDLVSYVGDMLSFYTDYQANESYLETATEFKNVLKLTQQFGFKYKPNASSIGQASFFIAVPSKTGTIGPNLDYAPVLRKGSTFVTTDGALFTLLEDVDFSQSEDIVVGSANATATSPANYAIKASGVVVSGELVSKSYTLGNYQRFLRLEVLDSNVTEIVSVADSNGNNYFEVNYLTQDVVYVPILNNQSDLKTVPNILKPISVPRRFIVEHQSDTTFLQFGYGTNENVQQILDPTSVILNIFGKNHFADMSFDPTNLVKTDKLGIVPSNTTLTVVYRRNTASNVNAATNSLLGAVAPVFKFRNSVTLNPRTMGSVETSLELTNEAPIFGDVAAMSAQELKYRAYGTYAAQNRAVTKDDYINLVYNMPSNFGQVKKATIMRDIDSFNGKNLNLYVISTNSSNKLVTTNSMIKQNLKTWIEQYKMLGDTIDILDAKIINLEIKFSVVAFSNVNKYDVQQLCINSLATFYRNSFFDIGEPFKITDLYKLLNNINQVLDTKDITVVPKFGTGYSDFSVPFEDLISDDGRYLVPPEDTLFEIKYPAADITGEVL